jgi:ATP-binding cassette, subfamily C (CFTR/MRP), member 1
MLVSLRAHHRLGATNPSLVNLLPHADHIIALSPEGTVAEHGTFQELNSRDGYVSKFCVEHAKESTPPNQMLQPRETSAGRNVGGEQSQVNNGVIIDELDRTRQLGDREVYNYYFKVIGRGAMFVFFLGSSIWAFFTSFPSK